MMADLAFRKNDYESAMFHFQQLLTKRPDYWVALARLVEVMRRTGHLEVGDKFKESESLIGLFGLNMGLDSGLSIFTDLMKPFVGCS